MLGYTNVKRVRKVRIRESWVKVIGIIQLNLSFLPVKIV